VLDGTSSPIVESGRIRGVLVAIVQASFRNLDLVTSRIERAPLWVATILRRDCANGFKESLLYRTHLLKGDLGLLEGWPIRSTSVELNFS
jgi:hypothetical protein